MKIFKAISLLKGLIWYGACLFFLVVFGAAPPAFGAELRIIDRLGLVRAIKTVQTQGRVVVKLRGQSISQAAGETFTLINSDSAAGEIKAVKGDNGEYVFWAVGEGTWRLNSVKGLEVVEVRILE